MIDTFPCPVCAHTCWSMLADAVFRRNPEGASRYVALRHRVLFELWAPEVNLLSVRFVLCEACGFVTYRPRPTAEDLDAKYRFLAAEERSHEKEAMVTALDGRRSRELARVLTPHLLPGGRVLDFGGGNGALLVDLVRSGFDTSVVDYVPAVVPGVKRLASTLDELAPGATFDVVVASHVLEHLAEPLDVLRRLAPHVSPAGVLFVEVPLELVGGPPRMTEPVTHVSFFCEDSLRTLLARAGFDVIRCNTVSSLFASGAYRYAVRAIGRRSTTPGTMSMTGTRGARRILEAGLLRRTLMAVKHPGILYGRGARRGPTGAPADTEREHADQETAP